MKIFTLAPKENWICDRIVQEWYENFSEYSVSHPSQADLIWLQAGWCWNHIPTELLKNKKVVCTEHHIVPEKFDKSKLSEFLFRDQFIDAYHVPNYHTRDFIQKITRSPIEILNYWLDPKKWYPGDRAAARKELKIDSDRFIIGSFQRDTEGGTGLPKLEKGPDLFCDYVEKLYELNNNIFILLGGWRREYIINRLNNKNIPFKFIERASIETIRKMYLCCDLYLVSSRHEGGPQALLEAPATKTPIISTDMGIARQVLESNCIVDISNKIYFPTIDDVNKNLSNVNIFNIKEYGKKYLEFFRKVLNNE